MLHAQCYTHTTNDGVITITGYTCSESVVIIPSSMNGLPVTTMGERAFFSEFDLV